MSVEGPCTSHSFRNPHSTRSSEGQNGVDVVYGSYKKCLPSTNTPVATPRESIMPVSTSSQSLLASLPSFMSVFGNGPDKLEVNEANAGGTQSTNNIHSRGPQFSSPFTRRDSASTFESTESSPTTTISTLGSTLTEPSPQSPPDSPDSSLPLPTLKTLRAQSVPGMGVMDQARNEHFSTSFPILPGLDRGDSPSKKMRNMKNLSVNTSASNRHSPQLPKLGLSGQSNASHAFSAPPTPAFIVPPKVPRKKPSTLGLTITTPEASANGQANLERPSVVPQTPSDHQIRTLRALQTSTNAPLFSPTLAPEGGMRLPPFSNQGSSCRSGKTRPPLSVPSQVTSDKTTSSPITRQTLDHVQEEPDYDLPLSQEAKSPAYPQGPVCIYDPHVYLYLEPSDIEAREFDVVLNVAREVKNPFTTTADQVVGNESDGNDQSASETAIATVSERQSILEIKPEAPTEDSESALETQAEEMAIRSPTTPKASRPEPEYVHVPWDHNTNVVDDLLKLCELIDSRARQEKRVLVHCQCGVSRSASLVVAYGIFKNPQLTVQEAYDAVKNRSRWIGPNMNLIYQLSEFKTKLSKSHPTGTSAWHSWRNSLNSGRTDTLPVLSPDLKSGLASSTTREAPKTSFGLSLQVNQEGPMLRANSFSPPGSAQLAQTSSKGDVTPGPSSAPPDMHFLEGKAQNPMEQAQHPSHNDITTQLPLLPKPTETKVDINQTLSPLGDEGIKQKEVGPSGAVAHDLQQVAKDLDSNEHVSASALSTTNVENTAGLSPHLNRSRPMEADVDEPISPKTLISPTKEEGLLPKPTLQTASPTLPAGFSSLHSRRQVPLASRQLPLRHEPLHVVSVQMPQRAFDPDVPPTPSLLSPRAAEFTASPFHRTAAGDLAGSSVFEQGLMSPKAQDEDPRSPAQRGEAPIMRSIFDMI